MDINYKLDLDINPELDLMSLYSRNSLVRKSFREKISFSESGISSIDIPERFNIANFIPSNRLDLEKISNEISNDLVKYNGIDRCFVAQIISGVCEAVKNAYEHGNNEDSSKEIFFAKSYGEKRIEFLVGDEGKEIKGNFIPFVLLFRQKGHKKLFTDIPDFYNFSGDLYAPRGHSGVGTKTMHISFDNVQYFISNLGGLLVHLSKNLP